MKAQYLATTIAALGISSLTFAQSAPDPRPGASTPVQVQNTASNPVPVTGNLTISNDASSPVPVAGTVTINNSLTSPLFVDGVVDTHAADTTETLYQNFLTVTTILGANHNTGVINTKGYKTVRLVIYRGSCSPCGDPVRVFVRAVGPSAGFPGSITMDSFLLDTDAEGIGKFATRVYEVPAEGIVVSPSNPPGGPYSNQVGVLVFGRTN